ncbi:MAG: ParB/RepB/Spo0J family partition protein [Sedimentisphaeraceae bacterium JB056]
MAKKTVKKKTAPKAKPQVKKPAAKKTVKHLGKGLQALMGDMNNTAAAPEQESSVGTRLQEIDLNLITPNPYQPRTEWDEQELTELVDSIRANGIVQPIVLRQNGETYQLIAGERRWRASKIAGSKSIPALIRDVTEEQMLELALVENIHRSDLNPIERAKAYHEYLQKFKLTQAEAAEKLGENRSVIANHIRLLDLPHEVKDMLVNKALSMGHARAILGLPGDELRKKLAYRALTGRLSVREVEKLVKKQLDAMNKQDKEGPEKPEKPANILDLETRMRDRLGTKVLIRTNKSGRKGKIVIDFYSLEEFDRLSEIMGVSMIDD